MTEREIIDAGIDYTMEHNPVCIAGDAFYEQARQLNRNRSFEAGAKWALNQLKVDEETLNRLEEEYEESLPQDYFWIEDYNEGEGTHGVCSVCEIEKAFKACYHKIMER